MEGKRQFRHGWLGISILICGSMVGSAAFGVEFKSGENVTVGPNEVVEDDLYMTGDTMTVEGRVIGDVVAAGRMVIVEGVIEGDLIAAGQAIVIRGSVTDDVRIAGMVMQLDEGSEVGDDTFAAGFSFSSAIGSQVAGKTGFTGYQAVLAGEHQQGLEASLVGLRLEGHIQRDVQVSVSSEAGSAWWTRFMQSPVPLPTVAPGLKIAEGARLDGNLTFKSVAPAAIDPGAEIRGETRHEITEIAQKEAISIGDRVGKSWRWLAVLFLLGSALLWLVPEKFLGIADTLAGRPVASFGWGLVTLIGFPVAMLLVFVLSAVLSMAFGLLTLGQGAGLILVLGMLTEVVLAAKLWIAFFYLVPTIVAYVAGRWILTKSRGVERSRFLSLLTGLVLLAIVSLIPFLGPVARLVLTVLGMGAGALWSIRYLAAPEDA